MRLAVAEMRMAQQLLQPPGSSVIMDQEYADCRLFKAWILEEVSERREAVRGGYTLKCRPSPSASVTQLADSQRIPLT